MIHNISVIEIYIDKISISSVNYLKYKYKILKNI